MKPKRSTRYFHVKCNVCGQVYKNHVGSTPCCGSIAFVCDENGENTTDEVKMYAKIERDNDVIR